MSTLLIGEISRDENVAHETYVKGLKLFFLLDKRRLRNVIIATTDESSRKRKNGKVIQVEYKRFKQTKKSAYRGMC